MILNPLRRGRVCCLCGVMALLAVSVVHAYSQDFVRREDGQLKIGNHGFYFVGANAYYLTESAARGDTAIVHSLFATATSLGFTVIRTWGFFDSSDSLDPAVIQYRPGVFNEHAFQALDFVIWKAKEVGIRLIIPLVNNWDDYGGMNQYVRWREQMQRGTPGLVARYTGSDAAAVVIGQKGQSYRVAASPFFGHDDFYTDGTIRGWFRNYLETIANRTNTCTGTSYRNEPTILGWELANEPRSSDRSCRTTALWVAEMSSFLKSLDTNHLVGTGEEGFDYTSTGYTLSAYNEQGWMFDGTAGISFAQNSSYSSVDFASIHLYPESWNLASASGNTWIRDHIRISSGLHKPLIVGELGVRTLKASTYDSWLTTILLDGAGGGAVWQLLEGSRSDGEGFGFRCPEDGPLCLVLQSAARQFALKSKTGVIPHPNAFTVHQNFPNPFNTQTTIVYELPTAAAVDVTLFNTIGQELSKVVEGIQQPGIRKELVHAGILASGTYFYRVTALSMEDGRRFLGTRKLMVIK
jgi:mannan endo-1,4-beta-mannosidase